MTTTRITTKALVLIALWAMGLGYGYGQACETCPQKADYTPSFCYEDSLFSSYCASFNEEKEYFLFFNGKRLKEVPKGDHTALSYLLELSRHKKLKLSAEHILFLQRAFDEWEIAWRTLGYTFTKSGLGIKVIRKGTGPKPQVNEEVRVHYAGYLVDGTPFDSSYDRNTPFVFAVGKGNVIKGWDEGILALHKGTEAWLYIPAEIAYGKQARGAIPANSTLIFKIEVFE